MLPERLKPLLSRATEVVVSLSLVLVAFLTVLFLLGLSFPEGTGLGSLMTRGELGGPGELDRSFDFASEHLESKRRQRAAVIARLSKVRHKVKDKPAGSIAWSHSRTGILLQDRHAIQTAERSGATVSFDQGSLLKIRENSLVILRNLGPDEATTERRASLLVLEGELEASVVGSSASPMELEVVTPSGMTNIRSAAGRESDAEVRVTVNPDKSSTFTVLDGTAEVVAGGRKVTLQANQAVTVAQNSAPPAPMTLPDPPVAASPAVGQVFHYRSLPERVTFAWSPADGAEAYRLTISRDPELQDVVHDVTLPETEFAHGNLRAGVYYWRVRSVKGWAESADAAPRHLEVVLDAEPPRLEVGFPGETVAESSLVLSGTAEPGSRVFIGDTEVPIAEAGKFAHAVELKRGLNVVVVEAVDAAGNVAYRSPLVNAKY